MIKEKLSSSSNIVKLPITILMHASIESWNIFFNKPFESEKDVQDFMIWLIRNWVMDSSIKDLKWNDLNQNQCVWMDSFTLSQEAIKLCLEALQSINKNSRIMLSMWTEEQISLILNKKSA